MQKNVKAMEIRNIERAKELIPQLETLESARKILSESVSDVLLRTESQCDLRLPKSVKMNVLNIVNCEYERIRKEVKEL